MLASAVRTTIGRRCMSTYQALGFGEGWIGALGIEAALEEKTTAIPSPRKGSRGHANEQQGPQTQVYVPFPYAIPKLEGTSEIVSADCGWGHSALLTSHGALVLLGRAQDFKNTLKHINTRRGPLSGLQSLMQRLSSSLFSEDVKPMVFYCPSPSSSSSSPADADSFASVSCSVGALTAAITKKGRLYIAGQNFYGQCGIGKAEPEILFAPEQPVLGLGEETSRRSDERNFPATAAAGEDNLGGEFASGSSSSSSSSLSLSTAEGDPVVRVSCGFEHVLAVTRSGQLFAWGRGDRGQLGLGTNDKDSYMSPARVLGTETDPHRFLEKKVLLAEANMSHSACVDEDGRLFIWGKMQAAQVKETRPDGNLMEDQRVPREVLVPSASAVEQAKVEAVTAGQAHFSFLTEDKRLFLLGMRGRGRTFDDSHLRLASLRTDLQALREWSQNKTEAATVALQGQGQGSISLLASRLQALLNEEPYYSQEGLQKLLSASGVPLAAGSASLESRHAVCGPIDEAVPEIFTQLEPLELTPMGPLANRKVVALKSDTHFSYALTDDGILWRYGWRGIVLPVLSFLHLEVADVSFGLHHGIVLTKKGQGKGNGGGAAASTRQLA